MTSLLVRNIGLLATNDPGREGTIGELAGAAVLVVDGRVAWLGPESELPAGADVAEVDAGGRVVAPGFVDAHTHAVFAGDRAGEFGRRLRGEPYEETLAAGGGILSTVAATRAATSDELLAATVGRLRAMAAAGTTTVEIKSGYGLEPATEARLLETAAAAGAAVGVDVVPTFLGAHAIPQEWAGDRRGYVDLVVSEMLPRCAPLAQFCDVFCEDGAFTVDESRSILTSAADAGLGIRLHANQLAPSGGAALAAEMGATSADHLDHVDESDLRALASAGTVGVLLPGVSFSMRLAYPDPRRFSRAGVTVAIATDANPGTSYVLTMPFVVALACLEMGMTPEDALWSATRGGALALGLDDVGLLRPGAAGDLVIFDSDSFAAPAYQPDSDVVHTVVKGGVVLVGGE